MANITLQTFTRQLRGFEISVILFHTEIYLLVRLGNMLQQDNTSRLASSCEEQSHSLFQDKINVTYLSKNLKPESSESD